MIGKKPGHGPDNGEATSVIGENSVFEGTFKVTGNLRVDGKFTGKLDISETLVVGNNGLVDAEVQVRDAQRRATQLRRERREAETVARRRAAGS